MPGGDRTGPVRAGPMTGRAAGYCAGYAAAGFAGRGGGFGMRLFGRGGWFGGGGGWRNRASSQDLAHTRAQRRGARGPRSGVA